mgnify:CR=1 FL=1
MYLFELGDDNVHDDDDDHHVQKNSCIFSTGFYVEY